MCWSPRLLDAARREFEAAHGRVKRGEIALIGMGKLGGREMTATSDLDLILLYDFDEKAAGSDGERSLPGAQYFTRLTQRLVAALSAPTAEGTLYAVDFRLRPSGNAGPLATHIDGFAAYQAKDAWTWEHMALTRARVIAGDKGLAKNATAQIRKISDRPAGPREDSRRCPRHAGDGRRCEGRRRRLGPEAGAGRPRRHRIRRAGAAAATCP